MKLLTVVYCFSKIYKESTQGALLATYEKLVTDAGATTWEELALGAELNRSVFLKVTIENTTSTPMLARFDDLKIEVFNAPTAMVVQENSYYPFGLNMRGLDYVMTPTKEDKFQYNGKEEQTDFDLYWSDYGARSYDLQVPHFTTIDRFAEKYYSLSPYQYVAGNPMKYIDVNGDSIVWDSNLSREHRMQIEGYIATLSKSSVFAKSWGQIVNSKNIYTIRTGAEHTGAFAFFTPTKFGAGAAEIKVAGHVIRKALPLEGMIAFNIDALGGERSQELDNAFIAGAAEEIVHAGQFDFYSTDNPFLKNFPADFNIEFEAKSIVGKIFSQMGNKTLGMQLSSATKDKIPFMYGASLGNSVNIETYDATFKSWQEFVDSKGGYGGKMSSQHNAVNGNAPNYLKSILKR
jgi:RHS repeat-associated protein